MKLVCISDTHGLQSKTYHTIPDSDILIHAGDLTNVGAKQDVLAFHSFIEKLPHKHKIIIAGNHDWCFANNKKDKAPNWLTQNKDNIHYLLDEEIIIDGIKFYGSPWQPYFFNWAFNLKRGKPLKEVWSKIPENTDVLITHGPPYKILDETAGGDYTGCVDLLERIEIIKPKVHVFGHIHEAYGTKLKKNITFVNASICNFNYRPINKPIVVNI